MRLFDSPDGARWAVEVPRLQAGASNAMILFRSGDPSTSRKDRYAWYQSDSPDARNVTGHLDPGVLLGSLSDPQLALLFRRSMSVSAAETPLDWPVTDASA